tara:strand:+ start:621 stop:899 length:279 start_codon:yes stop_codon:yes gene_type:complete
MKSKIINTHTDQISEGTLSPDEQAAMRADAVEAAKVKYKSERQYSGSVTYPNFGEQLDQLFRDVDSGKFGADAKTGEWYIAVKAVKDANPKP